MLTSHNDDIVEMSWHPIQLIMEDLLPLFKAHYTDYREVSRVNAALSEGPVPPIRGVTGRLPEFDGIRSRFSGKARRIVIPSGPDPDTKRLAEELQSHGAFIEIMLSGLEDFVWPEMDKLEDQVDRVAGLTTSWRKVNQPTGSR